MITVRSLAASAVLAAMPLWIAASAHSSGVQGVTPAGTENETLALLHYRLAATELPAAYSILNETATSNAAIAFAAGPGSSGQLLQRLVNAGRISGLQQTFVADAGAAPISLSIALFRDAASATAVVLATDPPGSSGDASVLTGPALGDASRSTSAQVTQADGTAVLSTVAAWCRGPLFLAVSTTAAPDTDVTDLVSQFVTLADARATAGEPANYDGDDLVLGNDGQQLALAEALDVDQVPADSAPAGFSRSGKYLYSNDQVVVDARVPENIARRLKSEWRRQVGEVEYFTATDRTRSVVSSVASVFADATGAGAAMAQVLPSSAAQQATLPLLPVLSLGDDTVEFRSTVLWPGNELRDAYTLQWRHGRVLLSIIVNLPGGQPEPAFLSDIATALEAGYSAHPLIGA